MTHGVITHLLFIEEKITKAAATNFLLFHVLLGLCLSKNIMLLVANGWVPSLLTLLVLAGGILLIWRQFPFARRFADVPLVLLFIIAGAVSWWTRHVGPPGDAVQRLVIKQPEDARYIIRGKVERPDVLLYGDEYMQFQLRVREIEVDGSLYQVDGGVLVRWSEPNRALVHGEEVTIEAGMLPTIQRINQGVHGIEEYYRLQGIHSSVRIRGPGVVEHVSQSPFWSVRGWASRIRQDLAEWLVESGTAHILAVSGVQQVYRTDYGGSIRVSREDGKLKISGAREVKNIAIR